MTIVLVLKNKTYILIIFVTFFVAVINQKAYAKDILYLNSYHIGYTWSEEVTAGVRSILDSVKGCEVFVEYLDTKAGYSAERMRLHLEMLSTKYANSKFDLILVSDNNALDFLLKYRHLDLFNVPLVYCGITDVENYAIDDGRTWGVWEKVEFEQMYISIEKLLPKLETLHVVVDRTKTGRVFYKQLEEIRKSGVISFKIRYIEDIDMQKMDSIFKGIPTTDAIFYGGVHIDVNGNRLNTHSVVSHITKITDVPIFTYPFFIPNEGLAGGIMSLGREQGKHAAIMAYNVLHKKTEKFPLLNQPQNKFVYDYSVLERFNADFDGISNDALLLSQPQGILHKYKKHFFIALSIIALLVTILFALFRILFLKNKYQAALVVAMKHAESSDKLKSKFLRNLSHEIRTPLNSIIGFSGLLNSVDKEDPGYNDCIDKIQVSGERLTTIIDDTLTLAKLETGDYIVELSEFKIQEILDLTQRFLQNKNSCEQVEIDVEDISDNWWMTSDKFMVIQILEKLIDNAIKFNKEGSVKIGLKVTSDKTIFSIKDNGEGIDVKEKEEIFLTFNKIERGYRFHHGIGAGLSIAKQFAMLINGNIWFDSTLGVGTTFYLSIPSKVYSLSQTEIL